LYDKRAFRSTELFGDRRSRDFTGEILYLCDVFFRPWIALHRSVPPNGPYSSQRMFVKNTRAFQAQEPLPGKVERLA
jgi:hypothetical protein